MKVFENIENNGYWIPDGSTYYIDVWEVDSTVDTGSWIRVQQTRILRADSEIVAEVIGPTGSDITMMFGANGEYTDEEPHVYDFQNPAYTLDDWVGLLTLEDTEVLKTGNSKKLVRYTFRIFDAEGEEIPEEYRTLYLKMGSYHFYAGGEIHA